MKVTVNESTLINIADAIREKEGSGNVYYPSEMGEAIRNLPSGGGGNEPTDEELVLTGDCSYRFAHRGWDWFIRKYGNRMTTENVTHTAYMFYNSQLEEIPFTINVEDARFFSYMFGSCKDLSICPKVRGNIGWYTTTTFANMLDSCMWLTSLDDVFTPEMLEGFSTIKVTSAYSTVRPPTFYTCRSLRKVPDWWYKFKLNPESTVFPAYSYGLYYNMFNGCYTLDEVKNIPVWKCASSQTSNMFSSSFEGCHRMSTITFETNEDGSPIETQWSNQVINLASVGFLPTTNYESYVTDSNAGITSSKRVTNDAQYQALKNDPDWYGVTEKYSRYNHDSAVETINSLPITNGSNTIQFKGALGSATDGGAINTLTEEEIAVATSKGWTVTLS